MKLAGRTVVVTGGAGPNMGRAFVEGFRAEGARVVAVDRDADSVAALAADLPDVTALVADVSTPAGADAAIEAAGERIDVLCNHAALGGLAGLGFELIDELPDEKWNDAVAVNLTAPFLLSKRAVRRMVTQGGGVIINTASVAGLRGARGGPVYTATKWGLIGLTQNIAATFGSKGIRCNAICPGPTKSQPSSALLADLPEQTVALLTRDRGKPEPCPPEQVAAVAVFLATDDAARINGAAIPVDGGWIAF